MENQEVANWLVIGRAMVVITEPFPLHSKKVVKSRNFSFRRIFYNHRIELI